MRSLAAVLALAVPGCACSVPLSSPDAGIDATPGLDAPATLDAPTGSDAPDAAIDAPRADGPIGIDAAVPCDRTGYPPSVSATRDERTVVDAARAALEAETGATITLDDSTVAVIGIDGGTIPLVLDGSITDPCERALAALRTFFSTRATLFRMPADLTIRVCSYDALTDAEIVRLHGGTYGGRELLGIGNDLLAHVTRSGTLRYFAGSYLPAGNHGLPEPCLDGAGAEASVVGEDLRYQTFAACVPGASGSIPIDTLDTRTAGASALYVDGSSNLHLVRAVDVFLAESRVTATEINSDLFCCPGASLVDCVGKTLIVDEIDGAILEQIPRCRTC